MNAGMRALLVVAVVVVGCGKSAPEAEPFEVASACRGGELACPRPIFSVKNFVAAQRYYRDKLGFKVDWEYGDPTDFGAVSRGGTQLFVCQGCRTAGTGLLWVATKDVDALYKELVKRGAIINEPPTDKPWGEREMLVADPDGNMLRIASRRPDRELVITRTINGPARLVFEAWTRPELFKRWVPKSFGMTLRSCEMDVRTGGTYRLVFEAPEPNAFYGKYIEVTPHSRIVWTNEESGADAVSTTTVTFEEQGETTRLVVQELHPSGGAGRGIRSRGRDARGVRPTRRVARRPNVIT